jgi:2-(1,2-epoxy-1,2-dihydrophenyl)acetyl-CoA isomerase
VTYPVMEGIEIYRSDGVLSIIINRPERHNALTPDQVNFIGSLCGLAEDDDATRVVVLAGSGENFCAGADLQDVDLSAGGGQLPPVTMGKNLYLPLLELSKPLIAQVNGVAAGGGLGLALCCDIRIASEKARFATAFLRIGITANDTVAWLLPRIVGTAKALELILLARPIDASEAERIGLVSYVVPPADLEGRVASLASALAAAPPIAVRLSKRMVVDGLDRSYRDHVLAQEYSTLANRVLADADIKEGISAFQEKRTPSFRGFVGERRWTNY